MKYTCKNCQQEVYLQGKFSSYNQMAIQDEWCEKCWYYEHWRPYRMYIGEKGFVVHGWVETSPPDSLTIYYEEIVEKNYEKTDWKGAPTYNITPARHENGWLQEDEQEIAKRLSKEYKTVVVAHGERPEERDKIFFVAVDGQLFVPAEEEQSE